MGIFETVCDVCDDTGTYHMDPWGYMYGGWAGGGNMTAHPCYDCHRETRWRADHIEAVEDLLNIEEDAAGAIVDRWFASDGDDTIISFAAKHAAAMEQDRAAAVGQA